MNILKQKANTKNRKNLNGTVSSKFDKSKKLCYNKIKGKIKKAFLLCKDWRRYILCKAVICSNNNKINFVIQEALADYMYDDRLILLKRQEFIASDLWENQLHFMDIEVYKQNYDVIKVHDFIATTVVITENLNELNDYNVRHYLKIPIEKSKLDYLFAESVQRIKEEFLVVPLGLKEETKILVKKLNYIDIRGRKLYYHLIEGEKDVIGATVRQSFAKETERFFKHSNLLLVKPSLMVNINNIKTLGADWIIFRDGTKCYFPKTVYNIIREAWIQV